MKMTIDTAPLHISKRSWRSLWQEYRIYTDRVELHTCTGKTVILANEIVDIQVRPPIVIGDFFRGKGLAYCWSMKLDMADLSRHVAIHRTFGIMKRLRFTPDNPEKFVEICRAMMTKAK